MGFDAKITHQDCCTVRTRDYIVVGGFGMNRPAAHEPERELGKYHNVRPLKVGGTAAIVIAAVTTAASDHSGTAPRIASCKRNRRSCASRIANIISSKTKRCCG